MAHTQPHDSIEQMAARWVTRIDNETLDSRERAAFDRWIQANPEHKQAFLRLARHQQAIKASLTLPTHNVRFSFRRWLKRKWRQPTWRWGTAGLTTGLVFSAAILLPKHYDAEHFVLATALGESQTITLSDGSQVTLNTDTVIDVHLSNDQRALSLTQGEAFFAVAKDTARPFVVTSGRHRVQAVGTAFSVKHSDASSTHIVVTEGKVALGYITENAHEPSINAYASAGQHAELEAKRFSVATSDKTTLFKALAWRDGRIVFSGEPLQKALQEFARYNPTPIVIKSPEIAALPIGGYFQVNDALSLAHALADEFQLEVIENTNGEIWLQRPHHE